MKTDIAPHVIWDQETSILGQFLCLGMLPEINNTSPLKIGTGAVLRSFTLIENGVIMGNHVQTGHHVSIYTDNHIGNEVSIGSCSVLHSGNQIGHRTRVHSGCSITNAIIEHDVFIGPRVVIPSAPGKKTSIGAFSRMGANSTLKAGVSIGKNCLIGAGSYVCSDIPDHSVVAGHPAKVIKSVHQLHCSAGLYEKPYIWLEDNPLFLQILKET